MNNKILAIIFIGLLVIYAATKIFQGNEDTSFDPIFVSIDTSQVTKITVAPKSPGDPYTLERSNGRWQVQQGAISNVAGATSVQSMLRSIAQIEIQRLVSRSREKWMDYEVDETNGLRISVQAGDKVVADFIVGRFNFNQQTRSATSYVRKVSEDDIFALDGFLSMSLNQGFDAMRDKTLLKFEPTTLQSIQLQEGPGRHTLSMNNSIWVDASGRAIDSSGIVSYISTVSDIVGSNVEETSELNTFEKVGALSYSFESGEASVVDIYRDSSDYIIRSNVGNQLVFRSDSLGVAKRIWLDLKDLVEQGE